MFDVFCYGAISLDISGKLHRPGESCRKGEAVDYLLSPGGDAADVALTLAGLGLKVALGGGPTGSDPMGELVREKITAAGVELFAPVFGKTSIAFIVLDESGERSIVTFHDNTEEGEIPVPEDAIKNSRLVYADGCYGRNSALAGSAARSAGIPSVLNLDAAALSNISLYETVIASEEMSKYFSSDPEDAARDIYQLNKGVAIVTLGEKGCICYDGGLHVVPAFPVEAVDTTGAGAAFAAGFIYAKLKGETLDACLEFAGAAGALKSMTRGSYATFKENDAAGLIGRRP
jgi:sugar/nucleoside kinase (ribokinase family)